MTGERPSIVVGASDLGWPPPWDRVAEIADRLGPEHWTLVGGLMVQLHARAAGLDVVRPTTDIDMVVHVETGRGRVAAVVAVLRDLGYELTPPLDDRRRVVHRLMRDADVIDLLIADHPAPSVVERLLGYDMVRLEGGTQALRRTVDAHLRLSGQHTTVSVPDVFGALMLKSAAHRVDSPDPGRHLIDAVSLLACLDDPFAIAESAVSGGDGRRTRHLGRSLPVDHPAWSTLPDRPRAAARAALQILVRLVGDRDADPSRPDLS